MSFLNLDGLQYFYNKGCELGDGDSCVAKQ